MLFGRKQKKEDKPADARVVADEKAKEVKYKKMGALGGEISVAAESDYDYRIIHSPHVSEKAGNISAGGQYIFKVFKRANKTEIKKAVEKLYGVNVEGVNIVYIPSKKRTVGKHEGEKKGYKKAVVRLRKGQTIDVAPK